MTNPEVVDLQFALQGQSIPRDYAEMLWQSLREHLPWLEADPLAGIHPLSGLSSGENCWYLSRRSHLTLRLATEHAARAEALVGATLALGQVAVQVGAATVRALQPLPALYSKFVAYGDASERLVDEEEFQAACRRELAALGMTPRLVCGKAQMSRIATGMISGFSLMLLDLTEEQNLEVQRQGLGGERKRGCGIFVPHKSIHAIGTPG